MGVIVVIGIKLFQKFFMLNYKGKLLKGKREERGLLMLWAGGPRGESFIYLIRYGYKVI